MRHFYRSAAPVLASAVTLAGAVAAGAEEPDLELGEYLVSECTTCHRPDAVNEGIPNIFGKPRGLLLMTMRQYGDGTRDNAAMRNIARSLSEEELAAIAAYLEQASPYR